MTAESIELERVERELLWRFSPAWQRHKIGLLFAIEQQLAESLHPHLDHTVAHARLAWWQEELQRLRDDSPRHPLTQGLAAEAKASGHGPPDLRALAECAAVDLACLAFENRADLDAYLHGWSVGLFGVATGLDPRWGSALRELELLQDFSAHARAGRIYWPLGHDPVAADPWHQQPLGATQTAALRARSLALQHELRSFCQRQPPELETRAASDPATLGRLWTLIALWRAQEARAAWPRAWQARRRDRLRLTLQVWWWAVQLQRGHQPAMLRFS